MNATPAIRTGVIMQLNVLVGTMTGAAQLVAQEIELTLDDDSTRVQTRLMDGLDAAAAFGAGGLYLVCTSTYGQGDVPDNARMLYESLLRDRPDLSGIRYGVIGLGDRTYADTFCFGPKKFDAILTELGATRIGDMLLHDASSGTLPEEIAAEWIGAWTECARAAMRETASA